MRKSFYKKGMVVLLFLMLIPWAGIIYAEPDSWVTTSLVFSLIVVALRWSMNVMGETAEREGGFTAELKPEKKDSMKD